MEPPPIGDSGDETLNFSQPLAPRPAVLPSAATAMEKLLEVLGAKHKSVHGKIAAGESVQPAQLKSFIQKLQSECLDSFSTVDQSLQHQAKGVLRQDFASVGT